jgi:hypothetical protein
MKTQERQWWITRIQKQGDRESEWGKGKEGKWQRKEHSAGASSESGNFPSDREWPWWSRYRQQMMHSLPRSIRSSWYQCVNRLQSQISTDNPLRLKSMSHYDQSASMTWCQAPMSPATNFILFKISCGFVEVVRPLWGEVKSVLYNCFWVSPAQSFSGPSPAVLMTIILLSQIWDSLNLEDPIPIFPQKQGPRPPGTGLNLLYIFGSYLTRNILRLRYKA